MEDPVDLECQLQKASISQQFKTDKKGINTVCTGAGQAGVRTHCGDLSIYLSISPSVSSQEASLSLALRRRVQRNRAEVPSAFFPSPWTTAHP